MFDAKKRAILEDVLDRLAAMQEKVSEMSKICHRMRVSSDEFHTKAVAEIREISYLNSVVTSDSNQDEEVLVVETIENELASPVGLNQDVQDQDSLYDSDEESSICARISARNSPLGNSLAINSPILLQFSGSIDLGRSDSFIVSYTKNHIPGFEHVVSVNVLKIGTIPKTSYIQCYNLNGFPSIVMGARSVENSIYTIFLFDAAARISLRELMVVDVNGGKVLFMIFLFVRAIYSTLAGLIKLTKDIEIQGSEMEDPVLVHKQYSFMAGSVNEIFTMRVCTNLVVKSTAKDNIIVDINMGHILFSIRSWDVFLVGYAGNLQPQQCEVVQFLQERLYPSDARDSSYSAYGIPNVSVIGAKQNLSSQSATMTLVFSAKVCIIIVFEAATVLSLRNSGVVAKGSTYFPSQYFNVCYAVNRLLVMVSAFGRLSNCPIFATVMRCFDQGIRFLDQTGCRLISVAHILNQCSEEINGTLKVHDGCIFILGWHSLATILHSSSVSALPNPRLTEYGFHCHPIVTMMFSKHLIMKRMNTEANTVSNVETKRIHTSILSVACTLMGYIGCCTWCLALNSCRVDGIVILKHMYLREINFQTREAMYLFDPGIYYFHLVALEVLQVCAGRQDIRFSGRPPPKYNQGVDSVSLQVRVVLLLRQTWSLINVPYKETGKDASDFEELLYTSSEFYPIFCVSLRVFPAEPCVPKFTHAASQSYKNVSYGISIDQDVSKLNIFETGISYSLWHVSFIAWASNVKCSLYGMLMFVLWSGTVKPLQFWALVLRPNHNVASPARIQAIRRCLSEFSSVPPGTVPCLIIEGKTIFYPLQGHWCYDSGIIVDLPLLVVVAIKDNLYKIAWRVPENWQAFVYLSSEFWAVQFRSVFASLALLGCYRLLCASLIVLVIHMDQYKSRRLHIQVAVSFHLLDTNVGHTESSWFAAVTSTIGPFSPTGAAIALSSGTIPTAKIFAFSRGCSIHDQLRLHYQPGLSRALSTIFILQTCLSILLALGGKSLSEGCPHTVSEVRILTQSVLLASFPSASSVVQYPRACRCMVLDTVKSTSSCKYSLLTPMDIRNWVVLWVAPFLLFTLPIQMQMHTNCNDFSSQQHNWYYDPIITQISKEYASGKHCVRVVLFESGMLSLLSEPKRQVMQFKDGDQSPIFMRINCRLPGISKLMILVEGGHPNYQVKFGCYDMEDCSSMEHVLSCGILFHVSQMKQHLSWAASTLPHPEVMSSTDKCDSCPR